jgi:hypothetical protein
MEKANSKMRRWWEDIEFAFSEESQAAMRLNSYIGLIS